MGKTRHPDDIQKMHPWHWPGCGQARAETGKEHHHGRQGKNLVDPRVKAKAFIWVRRKIGKSRQDMNLGLSETVVVTGG